jgi:hypothetical protein
MDTSAESKIGLSNLSPEDTLGCTMSWHVPTRLRVPVSRVKHSMDIRSLPEVKPAGSTPAARWKELVKNHRFSRKIGERDLRSIECKHADKGLVSYEFSVNAPSTETEKARLIPVGTMSLRDETMSFKLTVGPQLYQESDEDYISRALAHSPDLLAADCRDLIDYARAVREEVGYYIGSPHHSAVTIKALLKICFEQSGAFSVSSRGGFWFVPRTGLADCPHAFMNRVAEAIIEATDGAVRFTRMNIPKDATSLEGASEMVREDFIDMLKDLEVAVESLECNMQGQNDGRREVVNGIIAKLGIYKTLWGMAGDDIESLAARVTALIDAHDSRTAAIKQNAVEIAQIRAEARSEDSAERKRERAFADVHDALHRRRQWTVITYYDVRNSLENTGKAQIDETHWTMTLRTDDVLGLIWRITNNGVLVMEGRQPPSVNALQEVQKDVEKRAATLLAQN